jgi:Protein of unknown function (DUF3987)
MGEDIIETEGNSAGKPLWREECAEWPKYEEQSTFESAVTEATDQIQVAREMAITAALGAMATACQGLIDIKLPTNHVVQSSLMLLTIAESGERKTTLHNQFFKQLHQLQKQAFEKDADTYKKHEQDKLLWKHKQSALTSTYKALIKKNKSTSEILVDIDNHTKQEPPPPRYRKLLYDDTTPQALVQTMANSSPNACLLSSEANSVFSGHGLNELHHLNTLWSGGSVMVDRAGAPSIMLKDARLTLALMTQPSVIERFLSKRGAEARGMGFLARFLAVNPRVQAGHRQTKVLGDLTHISKFNSRISELMESTLIKESEKGTRELIEFSSRAKVRWNTYHEEIESEMQENKVYFHYKDHASKLMDNISRVAGIIHKFEGNAGDIDELTLQFSYTLCRRYSNHYLTHLAGDPKVITHTNLLVEYLMRKAPKGFTSDHEIHNDKTLRPGTQYTFKWSEITQYGAYALRDPANNYANLNEALEILTRMGHVKQLHKEYKFTEAIQISPDRIELKNGYEYTVSRLPLFDDQEYYQPYRAKLYEQPKFMITVNDNSMRLY